MGSCLENRDGTWWRGAEERTFEMDGCLNKLLCPRPTVNRAGRRVGCPRLASVHSCAVSRQVSWQLTGAEQSQPRGAQAETVMARRNPRNLAQLLEKLGEETKMCGPRMLGPAGVCFLCKPSPQSLSPWRGGVTRPTGKVIYSPLTTELTRHSEPGELMDDLTPARQPAAGGRPSGDRHRLCLQEAGEKAAASPPLTIVIIIFRGGPLRAQSRIVINLASSVPRWCPGRERGKLERGSGARCLP